MTLERAAAIEAVDGDTVRLRLDPNCDGCTGCSGRCSLFGALNTDGDRVGLPRDWCDIDPRVGDPVRVYLPERQLLSQARRGYGLPMTGLLLGALGGHALAMLSGSDADPAAVLGALLGTLAGIAVSKRTSPLRCRVGPAACSAVMPRTGCALHTCNQNRGT